MIRLLDLPRGSTVLVDERQVAEPELRLPAGPHVLAISAPLHEFYAETVVVRAGRVAELRPVLTRLGAPPPAPGAPDRAAAARLVGRPAPRCTPGPGYNADAACFDERPKPVNPPFVPVPADTVLSPTPSLLWVKVSAEGRTVDARRLRPSNDPAFEREVRNFVWDVTWHPGLKNGAPVEAWTQMLFPPSRP